jgi:anion-transporting  ArsA/GET3 family ATPase
MTSMLERKLLVVTGKGGVGKTTVAAALGLLAAERGARAIVVEVGAPAARRSSSNRDCGASR